MSLTKGARITHIPSRATTLAIDFEDNCHIFVQIVNNIGLH